MEVAAGAGVFELPAITGIVSQSSSSSIGIIGHSDGGGSDLDDEDGQDGADFCGVLSHFLMSILLVFSLRFEFPVLPACTTTTHRGNDVARQVCYIKTNPTRCSASVPFIIAFSLNY